MKMIPKGHWLFRFSVIIGSQFISQLGSNAAQFALLWWLTVKTGSATVLALAGSVGFLPNVLLSPFAGVWVDRLNRKLVMIVADLYIAFCALVLVLFSFYRSDLPVWLVLVIMALRAIGGVFHTPAWNALLPDLVPKKLLDRITGWNQFTVGTSSMIGPALGGILIAISLDASLWVDILGAIVASGILLFISVPGRAPKPQKNILRELTDGLKLMLQNKKLMLMAVPMLAAVLFFLPIGSLFPLMTNRYFGKTAWHSSLVAGAFGAGLLASSLLAGIRGVKEKYKLPLVFGSVLAIGILLIVSGLLPPVLYGWFIVLAAVIGFAGSLAVLSVFSHVQATIPEAALGRVFAVLFSIVSIATPIGLFIAAPFAETFGINVWFMIAGGCIVSADLLGIFRYRMKSCQ